MSNYKKFGELPSTDGEKQSQAQPQQAQPQQAQVQEQQDQEAQAQQPQPVQESMRMPQVNDSLPYNNLNNKTEMEQYLKNYRVVVVDVWAEWCAPCKQIAPRFEALAEKYASNPYMVFLKDNIDNPDTYHRELCSSIPTFFIYADGNKNARQFPGNEFDRFAQLVDKFHERLTPNNPPN